jgi:putative DNA primase/helicase
LKSTTFQVLGDPFYSNDIAAIGTKDAQEQVLGIWFIELDELDAVTRAADLAHVKAFVSRS